MARSVLGSISPRTKSFSSADEEVEARDSARKLVKDGVLTPNRAVRSMPTSRNSPSWGLVWFVLSTNGQATGISAVFTKPVEPAGGLTETSMPVLSSPCHSNAVMTAVALLKSATRRMSPLVWCPLKVKSGLVVTGLWKNQKPAVVLPLLEKRSSPVKSMMWPFVGPTLVSTYTAPKAFEMSPLSGGIDVVHVHVCTPPVSEDPDVKMLSFPEFTGSVTKTVPNAPLGPFVTGSKTWSQSWDVVCEPFGAPRTPVWALPSSSNVLRRLGTSRVSRTSRRGENLARAFAGARLARDCLREALLEVSARLKSWRRERNMGGSLRH